MQMKIMETPKKLDNLYIITKKKKYNIKKRKHITIIPKQNENIYLV